MRGARPRNLPQAARRKHPDMDAETETPPALAGPGAQGSTAGTQSQSSSAAECTTPDHCTRGPMNTWDVVKLARARAKQLELRPQERLVLLTLAEYTNPDRDHGRLLCWPSHQQLADETGISVTQLKDKWLPRLRDRRMLTWTRTRGTNRYRLHLVAAGHSADCDGPTSPESRLSSSPEGRLSEARPSSPEGRLSDGRRTGGQIAGQPAREQITEPVTEPPTTHSPPSQDSGGLFSSSAPPSGSGVDLEFEFGSKAAPADRPQHLGTAVAGTLRAKLDRLNAMAQAGGDA